MLLELRQTADHDCVFEVRGHHCFEQVHIVRAKLTQTLVHYATEIAVTLAPIFNDSINVLVALVEILDDFLEVATQQVFI